MRFLTADYLYPLNSKPLSQGVLQINDRGEVCSIFEDRGSVSNESLEVFTGVLCPGFVNAHCHLELSHIKDFTQKKTGLLNFIKSIQKRDSFSKEKIFTAIKSAEQQMIKNGIVAVADICNTADTLHQKKKHNLQYYNFIEVFGLQNHKIEQIVTESKKLRNQFRNCGYKSTITPHAPYSVPKKLMQRILQNFDKYDKLLTIHIQESLQEIELFENKKGDFFNWLKSIEQNADPFEGRNKYIDILEEIQGKEMLLVHNTFTKKEDLTNHYYCTCPKANLYIEDTLPNYNIFNPEKLCVGTDSLASNNSLSILEELQIIKNNSNFDLNTLLKIASKNGAEALGFSNLGTFEKGKTPGVNLISGLSEVKVIA